MSPEREVNSISGENRQWIQWLACQGLTNGAYRCALSCVRQDSNHDDRYLP
jgi:hypothetical protein